MSSTVVKIKKMPAIKQVILNPVLNKDDLFHMEVKFEPKKLKKQEASIFKDYGSTIFNEINNKENLLNSDSSSSVAVLNKNDKAIELQDIIDIYHKETNSCSVILDRKIECSAWRPGIFKNYRKAFNPID